MSPEETKPQITQDAESTPVNQELGSTTTDGKEKLKPTQALNAYAEEKAKNARAPISRRKIFMLYIAPLMIIGVFGASIFLLIAPAVGNIFAQLASIQDQNDIAAELNDSLVRLQTLSARSDQINADISLIESIVPEGATEVVNFQQKIRNLAQNSHSLEVIEASTGEKILRTTVSDEETDDNQRALSIIEIPSTFTLGGELSSIKQFIESIKTLGDFVIIGEMELRTDREFIASELSSINSGDWRLTITLIKYQFQTPSAQNQLAEVYVSVPETAEPSKSVIDYVRAKTAVEN